MARTRTRSVVIRQANTVRRRYQSRRSFGGGRKASLGVIAGLVPAAVWVSEPVRQGRTWDEAMQRAVAAYTGYSYGEKQWSMFYLGKGLFPLLGGMLIHSLANSSGINRMIARFKLPVEI